ncbi:hypothetical protein Vafri_21748, partial [Volvox africanus]
SYGAIWLTVHSFSKLLLTESPIIGAARKSWHLQPSSILCSPVSLSEERKMPIGLWTVFNGYMPPARWPSVQQIVRVGAWGGVAAAGGLYLVQPWDWIQTNLGLKKEEK